MRNVKFTVMESTPNSPKYERNTYEGVFHQWGQEGYELENSTSTNTIAICELPDGTIKTPYPKDLQFLSPDTSVHTMD